MAVFFRGGGIFSKRNTLLAIYFASITLSHGILDALTNTSNGVAFFSPIISTRYSFGFTPIESSPLSPAEFFGQAGYNVILNEIAVIWIPLAAIVIVASIARRLIKR